MMSVGRNGELLVRDFGVLSVYVSHFLVLSFVFAGRGKLMLG